MKAKNFILVYIVFYFVFLALNFNYLKSWSLSGDDLFSLTEAVPSLADFWVRVFGPISVQYRHLTFLFFNLYKAMEPNFFLIFLTHGLIFSLIPTLLLWVIGDKLSWWQRWLVVLPVFMTPIFYYHTFTISSLANVLMVITTLIFIYYFENRNKFKTWSYSTLFLGLLILAFAIKETFILSLTIFGLVQLLNFKKNKASLSFLSIAVILFAFYLFKRVDAYGLNKPTAYFFVFTFEQLKTNLTHLVAWLGNFPKGWQYGAPIRYGGWQYLISGVYSLLLGVAMVFSFLQNKFKTLVLGLFGFVSLLLFIFLNNVHVFYLDLAFIVMVLVVARAGYFLHSKNKRLANFFILSWFLINLTNLFLIKPQWLEYSFVANANQAAKNYQRVLRENNFQNYDQVCILNHHRGAFGTENGKLVNHLKVKELKIISTKDEVLPEDCQNEFSLNLVNDAWDYKIY